MSTTIFKDLLKKGNNNNNNKYNKRDNYRRGEYGLYNNNKKDLNYTTYSLEYYYYGYCDY